ncbi:MAG: histidine phosphatase family protein [Planctomycetes bacterium]|nr:histidine phosphatase family protein [Planctomycetota bacterium]
MWIHLLRHGIAEEPRPDLADEDRALTDEGRKRLRRAGRAWNELVRTPDVVITSPLQRARQTAEQFVEAVGFGGDLRVDAAFVPGARPELATTLLEGELLARTGSVAVVGHEPHLGYLLGSLLTGHSRLTIPLRKGMLVGLQVESTTTLLATLRFSLGQKAAARLT